MNCITIDFSDLSEQLQVELEAKKNDTLPQGQTFFLEDGKVLAVENNLIDLFNSQNREGLENGDIRQIEY